MASDGPVNVWCLVSSSPHNELEVKEIAAYALPLLRPGKDCAVLPSDPGTREFAEFAKEVLCLGDSQLIWAATSAPHMTPADLDATTAAAIRNFLTNSSNNDCTSNGNSSSAGSASTGGRPGGSGAAAGGGGGAAGAAAAAAGAACLVPYGETNGLLRWMKANGVKLPLFGVGPSPGSAAAAPSPAAASPGSGSGSPFLQASSSSSASKQQQQAAAAPLPSSRHKGIMHRRVQQLDKPAEVEVLAPGVAVPRGYTCSSVDDLLVAFRLLAAERAVVKPLHGKEGEGVLFVSSAEELRLYDFPLGSVALEEVLGVDKGPDGIPLSASHLSLAGQALPPYEKVVVGTTKFGMRSTQVSPEFEAITHSWSQQLLGGVAPCSPSYFHFVSHRGSPVLLGVRVGQMHTEHFAAKFLQQYAPGATFYCWHTTPQKELDVWTFWNRLQESGIAFLPRSSNNSSSNSSATATSSSTTATSSSNEPATSAGGTAGSAGAGLPADSNGAGAGTTADGVSSSTPPAAGAAAAAGWSAGVFPLLWLKGVQATLLVVGRDAAEVAALRCAVEACLHEPVVTSPLALVSWKEEVRRIWCSGPRPEYRRQTQRYNLSNRCLPLVRKGRDAIILPGGHEGTREFATFCKEVLELGEDQVIFTSGSHYNLDDDIDPGVVSKVKALVISNPNDKFTLVPYAVTPNFQRWASSLAELGVSVFGESLEWVTRFGHKGILHRSMSDLSAPSVVEQINPKIPVAPGYYCETSDQLLAAYKLLGVKDVVVKPVYGAAGEGIIFVHDEEELRLYDFPMGAVCLEEFLDLDRAPDGIVLSPAVHYMEGQLLGKGLVDQIMIGTGYSGWRPSVVSKGYQNHAIKITQDLIRHMQPMGPGGFDFLSVAGKPVLADVNTGRFNGAHSPKLFVEMYAPQKAFYVWKQKPPERTSVWQLWQRLQDRGLAFLPGTTTKGVFPMIFLPGLSGQYIAVADSDEEAQSYKPAVEQCLQVAARPRGGPTMSQKYSCFKRADIAKKKWRRIWCLSPQNSKFLNQFNVQQLTPLHAAPLLRPGVDLVLLPDRPAVREYWGFIAQLMGLSEDQVIWTNGRTNCLHTDIDQDTVARLQQAMRAAPPPPTSAAGPAAGAAAPVPAAVPTAPAALAALAGAGYMPAAAAAAQGPEGADRAASVVEPGVPWPCSRQDSTLSSFSVTAGVTSATGAAGARPGANPLAAAAAAAAGVAGNGHVKEEAIGSSSSRGPADFPAGTSPPTPTMLNGASTSGGVLGVNGQTVNRFDYWTIIPDSPSPSFQKWAQPLMEAGVRAFADQPEWMGRYGHKGVMHRHISKPGDYECLDGMGDLGVALPSGYICSTTEDLMAAYASLGVTRVTLRPIRGTASPGEGCLSCSSSQELAYYDFPLGDVVLEEDLDLAAAEDGLLLLPRVPYLAGERLGNTILDVCRLGDAVGGYRPSLLTEEEQRQVAEVTAGFLGRVGPKGAGALSYGLSREERRLVLLGVQMGTFVPEHVLKMFMEQWAEEASWFAWHHVPPRHLDIWTAWHRLTRHGIAFTPGVSTSGVFPLVYLRGTAGTFIAISDNEAELSHLRDLTNSLLNQPLSTSPLTPASWTGETADPVARGAPGGMQLPLPLCISPIPVPKSPTCSSMAHSPSRPSTPFMAGGAGGGGPTVFSGAFGAAASLGPGSRMSPPPAGLAAGSPAFGGGLLARSSSTPAFDTGPAAAMQAALPPLGLTQATLAAARAHQQLRSDSRGNILHPGAGTATTGPHAGSTGGAGGAGMPYSSSFGGLGPGSVYSSAAAGGGGGVSAPGSVAGLKMQPAGRLRRIFVTGPCRTCRQPLLRYVLPARGLALARRGLDVVVVPGGHDPTTELVAWAQNTLGLEGWQVVTTRGASYVMDEDMDDVVVTRLKQLIVSHPSDTWLLVPHDPSSPAFTAWSAPLAELGVLLCGEPAGGRASSRAMLFRSAAAPEVPSVLEQMDADIKVPPGYIATTSEQLLTAYGLLGGGEALVRPIAGLEGEGVLVVSEATPLALYDFQAGPVVVEKVLPLDRAPDGMVLSLVVPFQGCQVLARGVCDEVVVGSAPVGYRASEAPRRLQQAAISTTQGLLMEMCLLGQGVFTWGSLNGEPVLTGFETGRLEGPLAPLLLLQQAGAAGCQLYTWRCKPPPGMGPADFWHTLQTKGLAWNAAGAIHSHYSSSGSGGGAMVGPAPCPKGVWPLVYLRGLEVQLVAVGDTALDCVLLQDKVRRVLERHLKPPGAAAKGSQPGGASPRATSTILLGGSPRGASLDLGPALEAGGFSPLAAGAPGSAASLLGALPPWRVPKGAVDMTLLVGAEAIYAPQLLEERNVLIAGGKVIGLLDDNAAEALQLMVEGLKLQQCGGCIITPGFIDCHVHITGGGGEAGPASRCPPSRLSELLDSGITTVVGLLGTDDVSRTQEELIIRARALQQEGLTAYTWIGSYHAPTATATGSIRRDMCLVESAVGVGELAVADHRGSQLGPAEVARIAAEARVGGMLSGKAGLVHVHMGPGPSGLQVLREAVAGSDIPLTQFHPTHMDRSEELIAQGAAWLADGGSLDFTVRTIRARRALQQYAQAGLPLERITVSSDAFGSLPTYDGAGRLLRYSVADGKALLRFLRNMYFQERWSLERTLPLMTTNPARLLQLPHKGSIAIGADADLLVLRHDNLKLQYVYARGVCKRTPQWVQGGFFERGSRIRPFAPLVEEGAGGSSGGGGSGAGKSCCG